MSNASIIVCHFNCLPHSADYERLRIGGLVIAGLFVVGGLAVLLCKYETDHFELS